MLPILLSVNSLPEMSRAKPFQLHIDFSIARFGPRGTKPSSPPERRQLAQYSSSRRAEWRRINAAIADALLSCKLLPERSMSFRDRLSTSALLIMFNPSSFSWHRPRFKRFRDTLSRLLCLGPSGHRPVNARRQFKAKQLLRTNHAHFERICKASSMGLVCE